MKASVHDYVVAVRAAGVRAGAMSVSQTPRWSSPSAVKASSAAVPVVCSRPAPENVSARTARCLDDDLSNVQLL